MFKFSCYCVSGSSQNRYSWKILEVLSIHVYLYIAIAKINLLGRLNKKKKKKRSPVKTTDLASSMLLNKCLMTPDLQMKCIFGLTKVHISRMPECRDKCSLHPLQRSLWNDQSAFQDTQKSRQVNSHWNKLEIWNEREVGIQEVVGGKHMKTN